MFLFKKVENSDKPNPESEGPETNTMDRGENIPLYVGEIVPEINPIDYDSEDGLDEDLDEDDQPFVPVVERRDTVFSLEIENKAREETSNEEESPLDPHSTNNTDVKVEITIDDVVKESFIAKLCKLLSNCFTWSK